jgi:PAS domain S-box-containing protein
MTADRALANALPQIIWSCDAQGRLQWVNDRWFELTGLSEAQTLVNKGALVAIHPDDHSEIARHWAHALETSRATEFEYRIRTVSGEYRWHVARAAPVRGAGGEITGWIAAVFDIHDRRTAEEARRTSARQFDSFFHLNALPMAISRQSDGAYLFVNDAFTTLTGYSPEEAIGRTPMELGLFGAETRAAAAAHFSGGSGRSFELWVRRRDGRHAMLKLFNSHIEIDGVPCFLNTGLDVTQQRAVENALRESEAQANAAGDALRRANQQKDEFLALLSHELRNPLTPILTSARLLERRVDAESRPDVDVIVHQVKHVSRLVDDLLDVARVARGAITLSKTRLEPAKVMTRALAATAPLFNQRGHRLEIDIPEHGLAVDADEVRLTQIFDNLLSNAARYTPPGGTVRVSGRREGEVVILCFRDTGRGIERSLLPDLFELFVQGPRGADRAEGGLGMGLSLVRALTELHGGVVTAHSDGPGLGSEFTVRLPAAARDSDGSAAPSTSGSSQSATSGRGTRVLVVDDHREVADGLKRLLRLLGYDVRVELNPLDALATAEAFRPEIALLDLGLPTMDGYALAMELRARLGAGAPTLIALSGYNQPQDRRRSHDAGFATHLVKPIDVDDLVAALNKFGST